MRAGVIATMVLGLSLMVGLALLAPLRGGAPQAAAPLPDATMARFHQRARFGYQQRIVQLGMEPLEWACAAGSPDRARYYRSSCFAEHVADFQLFGASGVVVLKTDGDASFRSAGGETKSGTRVLSDGEAAAVRSLLLERMPRLPEHLDAAQMPAYLSAIEACIGGKPYFALRNGYDMEGDHFESVADELLKDAGVEATIHASGRCL